MRRQTIDLLRQTRNLLSFHQELGLDEYPRSAALESFLQGAPADIPESAGPHREKIIRAAAPALSGAVPPAETPPPVVPAVSLAELRQELAACRACPLAAEPQLRVTGAGGSDSGLLIVLDPLPPAAGDAPPLHGPADDMLTRMLAAINLPRRSVYVTVLPKCPPSRETAPAELRKCLPLLHREIEVLAARVICTMGPLAAQTVLGTSTPLFKLRGRFHKFLNLPLMPTFHPAYLLRNQEMKKATWQDLQAIQKALETKS
jgi:uracil-DNA glycosylase